MTERRKRIDPEVPVDKRGVRDTGYKLNGKFIKVPEMIPELIVPDLTDFKLKPYVSYRAPDIIQSEFTAEDLFNVVYAKKIIGDFKGGKLNEDGTPKEPSPEEKLTSEEATLKARQTGSDIF
ncbi:39S ribosomal protein L41, mitochondrial-like [Agrilus planipennis]|uniref:39S ribosomal protein L41, mitochondrial-like n=1 Tax=Agrilus planipennis TaxID=224129 RepID=A0A7F5RGB0_AGRPL|nr:39S ribosomal protein L41, mitochondrial-like [Agrilus planipennis]